MPSGYLACHHPLCLRTREILRLFVLAKTRTPLQERKLFVLAKTRAPLQERKRRDFLCEKRSRSRGNGGDWSTTTGGSSAGGRSNSLTSARSRSSSVRERMDYSLASGTSGGGGSRREGEGEEHQEEGGGGDGDHVFSSIEFSIAKRVNAGGSSATATETVAKFKRQENVPTTITGSSGSFPAASPGGHQHQTSQSTPSKPRLLEHHIPSLGGSSETSAKEGLAASDFPPSAQTESTGAAVTTTRRPRANGHTVAAPRGASSSRFLSPLLDADGASVGSSPPQLVNTTDTAATATAPASTVGGEGGAALKYPQHRRRYSSLSFAQNPRATTAEMIRRYRGQLRRSSLSSQQSQARGATALTTMPPLLAGSRRRSEGSNPWHYYVSATNAAGSGRISRPRTSVGGSRWSQDVRLQEHIRGRARLAPATRTAGGRWGASHGRLEALVPGDESESSSKSITYRIPHEGGPWVLDAEPRIELRLRRPEQEYPFPY